MTQELDHPQDILILREAETSQDLRMGQEHKDNAYKNEKEIDQIVFKEIINP